MSGDEKTEYMNDTLNSDDDDKEPLLAGYQSSLTSSPSPSPEPQSESESEPEPTDARQSQPPVSRLKRTYLFIFCAILSWLAYSNVLDTNRKPKVIHASRYSKDYKFRPAASPVITETLKDGRMRLRGALPEPTQQPAKLAAVTKKKKRRPKAGKASGKRKSSEKPRAANQQRM